MISGNWILIDETKGATTKKGHKLTQKALHRIASAVSRQMNEEYAEEYGGTAKIRVARSKKDIRRGDWVFAIVAEFAGDDADATAYHDVTGKGVPVAFCAIKTCEDLYGTDGVGADVSHEVLETAADIGANIFAFNYDTGAFHSCEICDPVEMQTYGRKAADGTVVQVSNFILRSFYIGGHKGPYDYMTKAGRKGAVAPAGPFKTAKSKDDGNYQVIWTYKGQAQDATDYAKKIVGKRRKGDVHKVNRAARRMRLE
jgi:hypothetical protein